MSRRSHSGSTGVCMSNVIRRYACSVENTPRNVATRKTHRIGGVQAFCIHSHYPAC